uniref:Ribonucleoside-diphosphate reductase n=1 Tax=Rhabditophanes sp. KR3021 TaxID=114890 RepID=A0AC35TZ83_9BILA
MADTNSKENICVDNTNVQNITKNVSKIEMKGEVLLTDSTERMDLLQVRNQEVWGFYQRAAAAVWFTEEVDLSKDRTDWDKLNDGERKFLSHVLAFFAASDGIVNANLLERFMDEVKMPEALYFYRFQIFIENIHSEMYSKLIEAYITDAKEKDKLFNALENYPCIKKKADWALKWINDKDAPFGERCIAFAAVEGIFFSGSFASIFWMKSKGKLHGLCQSNELISRDEGLHRDFACLMYRLLDDKPTPAKIYQIIGEAVEIEKEFLTESLPCSLLGMNHDLMSQYIEYVADHLLMTLELPKKYNTKNPFEFMENISLQGKTNFFERRVTEYQQAGVLHNTDEDFEIHEDF